MPRKKKVIEEEIFVPVVSTPVVSTPLVSTPVVSTDYIVIDEVLEHDVTVTEKIDDSVNIVETIKEEVTNDAKEEASNVAKEEASNVAKEEATKVLEISKEEANNVVLKTLSDLFLVFIKTSNNSNIVLSKESIDILNKIINLTPNFLDDVEKSLLEVIKDGKIDSNDLPHLILLIQKLYETIYKIKDMKLDSKTRTVICSEVLKNIAYFLIKERRIPIDEENSDLLLEQINTLIDSCIGLLSFSKSIKVKGCLRSLFGKKN